MLIYVYYINLYLPTSGSKEKITYLHINTMKKQQQKTVSKCACHYVVKCDNTIVDTSLLYKQYTNLI